MICALLIGREGSQGFPGKNLYPVMGRPLMAYPLLAATQSKWIERVYLSTDSEAIREVGARYGARFIPRPPELATSKALGEKVFAHGYREIKKQVSTEGASIEMLALLFCNAPTVTAQLIDRGIEILKQRPELDSAVSVSAYNMWSPLRARRTGPDGLLQPAVPFEDLGDPATLNCDRDSQGDVYFADMGVSVVRPRCLENLEAGLLPQRWMGRKIFPLPQWGGLDVDYDWQIPQAEYWLKAHSVEIEKVTS